MGAYLMAFPEVVADVIKAMKDATNKPISIKHRIGIDGKNRIEAMKKFLPEAMKYYSAR